MVKTEMEEKFGDLVMNVTGKCWGFSYLNVVDSDGITTCSSNFHCYGHRNLG